MQHGTCYFVEFSIDVQCGRRMSWINPEPIASAAPILVHGEVQDGYLQQHGAEDRINIEVVTSNESRLPKKESSSTAACVRQEADDRIDIPEFNYNCYCQFFICSSLSCLGLLWYLGLFLDSFPKMLLPATKPVATWGWASASLQLANLMHVTL